jgi:hypothetical protein
MNTHGPDTDRFDADEVTTVLLECEATLRALHKQHRLTAGALKSFSELAAKVRGELDRRQRPDRRANPRTSLDRRVNSEQ